MESDKFSTDRPRRQQLRSRPLPASRPQAGEGPTTRREVRSERRPRGRRRRTVAEKYALGCARYEAEKEEIEAKIVRSNNLSPEDRLREDGQTLLHRIQQDHFTTILLQPTPKNHSQSRPAKCQASGCRHLGAPRIGDIDDDYRICINEGLTYGGKGYYHVDCLDYMMDLKGPIFSKFKLDWSTYRWLNGSSWDWSLMWRKWFEQEGCIDLEKVKAYFDEVDEWEEKSSEFNRLYANWIINHGDCAARAGTCNCPPQPKRAPRPTLKDYITTKEAGCGILDVLKHAYRDR